MPNFSWTLKSQSTNDVLQTRMKNLITKFPYSDRNAPRRSNTVWRMQSKFGSYTRAKIPAKLVFQSFS